MTGIATAATAHNASSIYMRGNACKSPLTRNGLREFYSGVELHETAENHYDHVHYGSILLSLGTLKGGRRRREVDQASTCDSTTTLVSAGEENYSCSSKAKQAGAPAKPEKNHTTTPVAADFATISITLSPPTTPTRKTVITKKHASNTNESCLPSPPAELMAGENTPPSPLVLLGKGECFNFPLTPTPSSGGRGGRCRTVSASSSLSSASSTASSCPHKTVKAQCALCKGRSICIHGVQKAFCKQCVGSQICKHSRQKRRCKECPKDSIASLSQKKGGSVSKKSSKRGVKQQQTDEIVFACNSPPPAFGTRAAIKKEEKRFSLGYILNKDD